METFTTLAKYNLKLNPTKCTFRVKLGKFLGYITFERCIEANKKKIEAVVRLTESRCAKDVQRLNGCTTALGRFISKSTEKCMPIFKALKSFGKDFKWSEECSRAWRELKTYFAQFPLLCSPIIGDQLYLTSVSNHVATLVLIREVDSKQHLVYFVSKVLNSSESRYSNVKN